MGGFTGSENPSERQSKSVAKGTFLGNARSGPSESLFAMRASLRTGAVVLGFFCACAGLGAEVPRADVVFDHPEHFTDIKDRYFPTQAGEQNILNNIRTYLVHEANYFIPAGDHLTIMFTDIDLAGDFEPWLGPQLTNVRIIRTVYPPGFKFTYRLTDAAGKALRQGSEKIRDMNFEMRLTADPTDQLRYEKDILSEWMQRTFRDLKKG
jgi:hypothetical protein